MCFLANCCSFLKALYVYGLLVQDISNQFSSAKRPARCTIYVSYSFSFSLFLVLFLFFFLLLVFGFLASATFAFHSLRSSSSTTFSFFLFLFLFLVLIRILILVLVLVRTLISFLILIYVHLQWGVFARLDIHRGWQSESVAWDSDQLWEASAGIWGDSHVVQIPEDALQP